MRVFSCCSDWEDRCTAVLFFLQKACALLYKYARRDEVRRLTREGAPDDQKKNDTAYTSAKFVRLLEGEMECERERTIIARTNQIRKEVTA